MLAPRIVMASFPYSDVYRYTKYGIVGIIMLGDMCMKGKDIMDSLVRGRSRCPE